MKKGLFPVAIAGDDTTFYVIDRKNPLSDGKNPHYFGSRKRAMAKAKELNQRAKLDASIVKHGHELLHAMLGMLKRYHESPGTYTPEGSKAREVIERITGRPYTT